MALRRLELASAAQAISETRPRSPTGVAVGASSCFVRFDLPARVGRVALTAFAPCTDCDFVQAVALPESPAVKARHSPVGA